MRELRAQPGQLLLGRGTVDGQPAMEHVCDRPKRRALEERRAVTRDEHAAVRFDGVSKHPNQPRLADSGIAGDGDDGSAALLRLLPLVVQKPPRSVAVDEPGELAAPEDVETAPGFRLLCDLVQTN